MVMQFLQMAILLSLLEGLESLQPRNILCGYDARTRKHENFKKNGDMAGDMPCVYFILFI